VLPRTCNFESQYMCACVRACERVCARVCVCVVCVCVYIYVYIYIKSIKCNSMQIMGIIIILSLAYMF